MAMDGPFPNVLLSTLLSAFVPALSALFVAVNVMIVCGKKQKKNSELNIRAPEKDRDGVAGTYDPNYQTLNAVGNGDCFGADKANQPKAPQDKEGVAGTYDPNYQTLNAVGNGDCFGQDKAGGGAAAGGGGGGGGGGPKAPADGGAMAGTHDPNYQTLAGMGQDCFGADKAGGGGGGGGGGGAPKAPAAAGGMAGTHDPNYQTLAGMGNDCFAK